MSDMCASVTGQLVMWCLFAAGPGFGSKGKLKDKLRSAKSSSLVSQQPLSWRGTCVYLVPLSLQASWRASVDR